MLDRPRRRATPWLPLATCLLLTALPLAPAHAFPNEPDGFGAARFGMSLQQVRAHYPKLEALLEPGASSNEMPITLEAYQVAGQSVLGLSGCRVRFYFANDELYRVGFDCDDDAQLFERLKETYGSPTQEGGGGLHWLSERRSVSLNPTNRHVSYADRPRDVVVQELIYRFAKPDAEQPPAVAQAPATEPPPAVAQAPDAEQPPAVAPAPATEQPPAVAQAPHAAKSNFDWYDQQERLDVLWAQLDPKKDPKELVALLTKIALFMDDASVPHVAPYLKHENADVFDAAATVLEVTDDDRAAQAFEVVFDDPKADKPRRLRAIEALESLLDEHSTAAVLGKALADSDPEVRREAAMTIVMTSDSRAPKFVREALARETDSQTRAVLERALEILGGPPSSATSGTNAKVAGQGAAGSKATP